jgi:hypothetical protein
MLPRREFLQGLAVSATGLYGAGRCAAAAEDEPLFATRGVVLVVKDMQTLDWPERAKAAGLTTIGTHIQPGEIARFVQTDSGRSFLERCRRLGIAVEHELHAMSDLLPRALYDKDPAMFPMNDRGERVRGYNLCVHSKAALDVVAENVTKYTRLLPSTTGRYFYWIDDGRPMCRCPKCRELSTTDQALLVENHMLQAIRQVDPRGSLAHLCYAETYPAPTQIKPAPGMFLEFAPISRRYDRPLRAREAVFSAKMDHGKMLDYLDANLEVFGRRDAQALEYWLDESRFCGWRRERLCKIPWRPEVFADDLDLYARRGVRHITTFAAWVDAEYVRRFGDPPVAEYGAGLAAWRLRAGQPVWTG